MELQPDQTRGGLVSLTEILTPITPTQFVAEHFGRSPVHLPGESGRFAHLLDWDGLACLLEASPLDQSKLQVVKRGVGVPPERYTHRIGKVDRLDAGALSLLLDSGATLILNYVDDQIPAIGRIADEIADSLRAYTTVNAYANWRSDHGFDAHWDCHDVLVLQLAGRKNWPIYRPNRPNPLRGDPFTQLAAGEEPDREVMLEDGDVLYLPRGWIHAPLPAGEASLHLTISITQPTGASFLEWFAAELRSDPQVRAAIPSINQASFDEWKHRIAAIVGNTITHYAERYVWHTEAQRGARPRLSFRDFGRTPQAEWDDATVLRPASLHRLIVGSDMGGETHLELLGKSWPCSAAVGSAIRLLSSTRPLAFGTLRQGLSEQETTELRQLLGLAALAGQLSATKADD